MDVRGARHSRRWRPAVAVVAAFSLFVSLITGSALRSQFSAAGPPEPAAWLQQAPVAGGNAVPAQSAATTHHHAPWGASPTNKKPFHSTWMTHDRPDGWSRLQPVTLWSALPISFANMGFPPSHPRPSAPAADCKDREILTLLCVARR
ncbi:hypothetical protein A5647_14530 [Mycobacterium sp. 1100029.7]|nr:hypothetical protein A5647_14530 [Mycobacterium sp. 1100029.7]